MTMKKVSFLKEETFPINDQCHYCNEIKRVGFIVAMEGGEAFSVCRECGEETIRSLNLGKISDSIWAPSDVL
jgi:hypothetical protein